MRKRFFTFFELVLVAGCAAVIAALTIAAAGSMAKSPQVAACANIMRGIDHKLTAWENDHDGHMIAQRQNRFTWGRQLISGGYFSKKELYNSNMPRNFECPAETRQRLHSSGKKLAHPSANIINSYDYGLNHNIHLPATGNEIKNGKRADVYRPSQLFRLIEATSFRVKILPDAITARHGEGAGNVMYVDGHIKFLDVIPYKGAKGYRGIYWFNVK